MHIIQRYRAFQQEGLKILAAQSRVVTTSSGITEYAYQGDGSALLISHGSFGGFDQGLLSVNFLNDIQARFIAPSRFGYLETPMPPDASPQAQARAYVDLLDTIAVEKVYILGLSAGGMSALQFALQFPDRCQGIILVSAVSHPPTQAPPIRFMVEHVLTNEFFGWVLATYFPRLITLSTGDDYSLIADQPMLQNAFLNLAWPPFSSKRRIGMLNDLHQADGLGSDQFDKIETPMLVIHGTKDPFVPFATAKNLAAKVPGARLLELENGGHLSFLIQHKQSKAAILNFLAYTQQIAGMR